MLSTRHLLVAGFLALLPGTLSAQGLRSDLPPQRPGYPIPYGLEEYPNQGPIGLSYNELRRVLELARYMETGEREAYDRIFNRMKDKRNDFLVNLRVGYDWETPPYIGPYAASPPPEQRYELRTRIGDRYELRTPTGERYELRSLRSRERP